MCLIKMKGKVGSFLDRLFSYIINRQKVAENGSLSSGILHVLSIKAEGQQLSLGMGFEA